MTRQDHALVTGLYAAGLALALFQCWYIYLPLDEAARFDVCRFTAQLDCFESLGKHGADLVLLGGLPAIPLLAAVLLFQLALSAFAWTAPPARREAWVALTRVVSFPASGLAIYVLLSDYLVARTTSVSALLIAGISLTLNVVGVLKGLQGARLREGWGWAALLASGALLFCVFVHGAGAARREIESVLAEREEAPPSVRWATLAPSVPRKGVAALGSITAPAEVLLFLDLENEPSRALAREALQLMPRLGDQVRVYLYGRADHAAGLLAAEARGAVEDYLRAPGETGTDASAEKKFEVLLQRIDAARQRLGIERYPTALWEDESGPRTRSGSFRLLDVLDAARRKSRGP